MEIAHYDTNFNGPSRRHANPAGEAGIQTRHRPVFAICSVRAREPWIVEARLAFAVLLGERPGYGHISGWLQTGEPR